MLLLPRRDGLQVLPGCCCRDQNENVTDIIWQLQHSSLISAYYYSPAILKVRKSYSPLPSVTAHQLFQAHNYPYHLNFVQRMHCCVVDRITCHVQRTSRAISAVVE